MRGKQGYMLPRLPRCVSSASPSKASCPISRPLLLQSDPGIPTHESECPCKTITTQSQIARCPVFWYLRSVLGTSRWSWSEHGPASTHADQSATSLAFCRPTPCPAGHQWRRAGGQIFAQACHWSWGWNKGEVMISQVHQRLTQTWRMIPRIKALCYHWIMLLKLKPFKLCPLLIKSLCYFCTWLSYCRDLFGVTPKMFLIFDCNWSYYDCGLYHENYNHHDRLLWLPSPQPFLRQPFLKLALLEIVF